MFAYVDETGNTGQNIFDEAQPHFLTAALVTKTNFDLLNHASIRDLAKEIGAAEIHANELGVAKVEVIAPSILRMLKKSDARFVFSNLEKKYLAVTKIVDYVFDTGENLAVPWQAYNLRPLRLMLVFKVAGIVDVNLAKDFWAALMEPNKAEAYKRYVAACREMLARVDRLPDARSREIISDALKWVIENSSEIQMHSASKDARYQHLPNMVAFMNLMEGLEAQSKRWQRPVKLIVHDEQMQFERNLKKWHELYSNASPEPLYWPGDEPRIVRMLPGSKFTMSSDSQSPGIQIADVLLWLFKRMVGEKEAGPVSTKLLRFALSRAWYQDLSFRHVSRQLQEHMDRINSADISQEQWKRGHQMLGEERERRRVALAKFEETKALGRPANI